MLIVYYTVFLLFKKNIELLHKHSHYVSCSYVREILLVTIFCVFRIPREKKVPPPKQLTKWEQYAKEKGITKKKKEKKVWDDVLKVHYYCCLFPSWLFRLLSFHMEEFEGCHQLLQTMPLSRNNVLIMIRSSSVCFLV